MILADLANTRILVINPIIYTGVSIGFEKIEEVDEVLSTDLFRRDPLPFEAGFLAGKAFLRYRRTGGGKTAPLPEFYNWGARGDRRFRYRHARRPSVQIRTMAVKSQGSGQR